MKEFYLWVDGDCQDKDTSLSVCVAWAESDAADGKDVYIVDSDGNVVWDCEKD